MNNVKYFLGILIVLWLFGFLYVMNNSFHPGGRASSDSNEPRKERKGSGEADNMYDLDEPGSARWAVRFKEAMKQLEALEARNRKNEELIENLQLVRISFASELSFLYVSSFMN